MYAKNKKQRWILFSLIILMILVISILLMLFLSKIENERILNPFKWKSAKRYHKAAELDQFVTEHPEELDALAEEIYQAYIEDGEVWIYLNKDYWEEYDRSFPVTEKLVRENIIQSISAGRTSLAGGTETFWLRLEFNSDIRKDNGLPYSSAGVYYVENGEPMPWETEMEGQNAFEEVDGTYVQTRTWSGAVLYQTKAITENWYYYLIN